MDNAGSSDVPNQICHNEKREEHACASMTRGCPAGHNLENRRHESGSGLSSENVNLDSNRIANGPLFLQSSSSNSTSQALNTNAGSEGQGLDDCQIVERPLVFRSGSGTTCPTRSSSSVPYNLPSDEYAESGDSRSSSLLEGQLSRKRKATEENVGQSSGSGSSNYFQHAQSSVWRSIPAPRNTDNSLNLSAHSETSTGVHLPEQVNSGLALGVGDFSSEISAALSTVESTEPSHRNLRLRINSSPQQDSLFPNVFTVGNAVGSSSVSAPHQASRLLPRNNSSSPAVTDANSQVQSLAHVPAMRRNLQSSRWTRSSSSRAGSASSSAIEGDAASPAESSSRIMSRSRLERLIFGPPSGLRDLAQSPVDLSSTSGNVSVAGNANVASSSRSGPAEGSHQGSGLSWFTDRSSPQYSQRLSDLVRRSLPSASGPESGGQNINVSSSRSSISTTNQETPLPSEGQGRPRSRSAMLLDRHLAGASRISHSLRTLAAAGEGRSRLVSEQIRDALDLMRRGDGLRFEDVMILDQSFFGMGDFHDRHRDMRLDVDNMSYEELLALEERIGNVETGASEETILSRLKQSKYTVSATSDLEEREPCCICQDEYNNEDDLGELECGHSFHAECIKKWLTRKNLCPICKTTAMDDKEKA
ncbi:putative E3 ubiquitin-protein ligase HIP1 [Heracleum sosnowskyi]|uniref:RING-type E3 ubiquitin transferase n=1 Tax=Heracleum sosnowskyi TaxID=360622 RepID=A0AAD8JLF2_9APIA|nr:putative E3 ubiquitin-protein ligase HIP1 [Heracleum sosnowskyi]